MNKAIIVLLLVLAIPVCASVTPWGLFTDNAVLQQGISVPVWGMANDGEKVTVKLQGQEVSTTAHNGRWMLRLKPLKPGGQTMPPTLVLLPVFHRLHACVQKNQPSVLDKPAWLGNDICTVLPCNTMLSNAESRWSNRRR